MPQPIRYKVEHQLVHWLVGENNFKLMYSCARVLDILLENAEYGMLHRYPNYIDGETLARIGKEAGLTRSPFHTNAEYAARLKQRTILNNQKGSAERLIREVAGFFGAAGQWDACMTIYGNGERLSMQPGDSTIYKDQTTWLAPGWAWCTVVVVREDPLTAQETAALQATCLEFKAAHIKGMAAVLGGLNHAEFYDEIPQLPAPMTALTVRGVGGLYSESGEFYDSADPVIFRF